MRRNAIATIVLCVALGAGSAYAAGKLGSGDIAKNAVRSRQLATHALTSKHGVIRTRHINISDPHPNTTDFTSKRLLRFGPFTIRGQCLDAGAAYYTKASISSKKTAWASGVNVPSGPPMFGKDPVAINPTASGGQPDSVSPRAVNAFAKDGRFISVQVFAALKAAGSKRDGKPDCTFWVQGFGRR